MSGSLAGRAADAGASGQTGAAGGGVHPSFPGERHTQHVCASSALSLRPHDCGALLQTQQASALESAQDTQRDDEFDDEMMKVKVFVFRRSLWSEQQKHLSIKMKAVIIKSPLCLLLKLQYETLAPLSPSLFETHQCGSVIVHRHST